MFLSLLLPLQEIAKLKLAFDATERNRRFERIKYQRDREVKRTAAEEKKEYFSGEKKRESKQKAKSSQ